MTLENDLFGSFRSPCSYLATSRLVELFGQDRIDRLLWRLRQNGLAERGR